MRHTQNGSVWADGAMREWSDLSVPLMSDAILRAASVFDGIRADLTPDGRIRLLAGRAHIERLVRSARIMRLPLAYDVDEILLAAARVAQVELASTHQHIAYVRPMLVGAALTEHASQTSLTIAAFAQDDKLPDPIWMQIAALRRPSSDSVPPEMKAVANYQQTRMLRMAAQADGYADALLLNEHGRLAESTGAAVVVEHAGRLISPPTWESCLPSVTIEILERLAREIGIAFVREPVPLASVLAADGLALAGTLASLVPVCGVDGVPIPSGPAIGRLRDAYLAALHPKEEDSRFVGLMAYVEFSERDLLEKNES
ncbi:aminotransferase class IV [Micromonospora sp. RV43]|uniref:aminotransferase class IV n=2 Tax=unclassified Micromonospora TaxID=2617518 RepID=UPI000AADBA40|nr:aminotransferase class IV [Micromonospora sp. RV43]